MTQQEKDLLLKDLCARLPYGVKVESLWIEKLTDVDGYEGKLTTTTIELFIDKEVVVTPYLRPMSSMTKDEREDYFLLSHRDTDREDNVILIEEASELLDWLNKNMFDYRDLIEKGLAIEAPEGIYN